MIDQGDAGRADDRIRAVVDRWLPDGSEVTLRRLGGGVDHVVYELPGGLVVRAVLNPDPAARAEGVLREIRVLRAVAERSTLPVPVPRHVDEAEGCLAYPKLPGEPLLALEDPRAFVLDHGLAATIGRFLGRVNALPLGEAEDLVERDVLPPTEWRQLAYESYSRVADAVPSRFRADIGRFFAVTPADDGFEPVFSHNDLGVEHILVDRIGRVTGIIDWADAAIVDPAADPGRLYRDLGPDVLDRVLAVAFAAPATRPIRDRARFYGRCWVFEDLEHGLETGHRPYVDKALVALEWLFRPGP